MPRSLVVIVYSPGLALVRRVTVPEDTDPDDWDASRHRMHARNLLPGERAVVVPLGLYRLLGPDAALARVLGRRATSDRCAVVDPAGRVVGHLCMDPAIDPPHYRDGHRLVHDPDGRTRTGDFIHRVALP